MLSQIYKLISGVIAGRMKELLGKLISGCQKAYQNTANIGEIILDIIETIAICNHHKKPAAILLIDFSKAFDSISHNYIYESLSFFNFGDAKKPIRTLQISVRSYWTSLKPLPSATITRSLLQYS